MQLKYRASAGYRRPPINNKKNCKRWTVTWKEPDKSDLSSRLSRRLDWGKAWTPGSPHGLWTLIPTRGSFTLNAMLNLHPLGGYRLQTLGALLPNGASTVLNHTKAPLDQATRLRTARRCGVMAAVTTSYSWSSSLDNNTENVAQRVIQYEALLAIFFRWSFQLLATKRKHRQGKHQGSFFHLTFLLRRSGWI
jgi:hypothetical protein